MLQFPGYRLNYISCARYETPTGNKKYFIKSESQENSVLTGLKLFEYTSAFKNVFKSAMLLKVALIPMI